MGDAMIVAGGRGTRLWPLTEVTPKPLLPLAGTSLLKGQIARLASFGIRRVWLVVGARTRPFDALVSHFRPHGIEVRVVPEPSPLDTAGGVRAAIDDTSGPVVVGNGDILTDVDIGALVAAHRATEATATISVIRVADTSSYGVCVREGTRIVDFVEKPSPGSLPGQDTVNAGTYVLAPGALDRFDRGPLSFERTVFPGLVADGDRVESVVWDGVWGDLGTPARLLAGQRQVLGGEVQWPLEPGLVARTPGCLVHPSAALDPAAILVAPVLVLRDARVGAAQLGPNVVVGSSARVGDRAALAEAMLRHGASVDDDVDASHLLLGRHAAVTGAGTVRDVVVGDGVRVRAADVGDGDRVGSDA